MGAGRAEGEIEVDGVGAYRKVRVGAAHDPHERRLVRALSPECMGVLARLGIYTTNALPYHPQSKPIESWFGNRLHKRFDQLWVNLYCGTSPATRPEGCDEALKQHRLFMDGKRKSSPLPAASDFVGLARHFIQEYNTKLPHSGNGMNDRTPEEVFAGSWARASAAWMTPTKTHSINSSGNVIGGALAKADA